MARRKSTGTDRKKDVKVRSQGRSTRKDGKESSQGIREAKSDGHPKVAVVTVDTESRIATVKKARPMWTTGTSE